MCEYRLRSAGRNVILLLIACALLFVSSAQQFVVAHSLAIAGPSQANHIHAADIIELDDHHGGSQLDESRDSQSGLCNELSCVAFVAVAAVATEITSADGQRYLAAVWDDMNGHDVFDLMRPPRI
jgi:hypothetical protein